MSQHGLEITEGDPAKLFKINTKLGEGSYGSVYSAIDNRDNTEVAIKVLEVDQADVSELRKEVNILKSCSNPFVVGYRGCWEKGRNVWIVMEFCAGGSLGDLLLLCNLVLDEAQCRAVMYMTLQGLVYLHQRKLIHRDIKAANILLGRDGVCKLGDFGVSAELTSTMAKRKTAVGTPYWMAPEMLASSEYDSKADIWSLAITAIELCAGEPPHAQQHPMRVLFLIPTSPPPTIPDAHKYSTEFLNFLEQSLNKNPAERPDAAGLLRHIWFKNMTIPLAQSIVRKLVLDNLSDIDACREQDRLDSAWNGDNIIATSGPGPGAPNNATFNPDMIQDNLSYYPSPTLDGQLANGGDTMVVAPSVKAAIQSQQHQIFDDEQDYTSGTTVILPETANQIRRQTQAHNEALQQQQLQQQNSYQNQNNNNGNIPPSNQNHHIQRQSSVIQVVPGSVAGTNAASRSPNMSKHGMSTMVIKDEQYKDLLQRPPTTPLPSVPAPQHSPPQHSPPQLPTTFNNKTSQIQTRSVQPPSKLPIPQPPTHATQYSRIGSQTPHNILSSPPSQQPPPQSQTISTPQPNPNTNVSSMASKWASSKPITTNVPSPRANDTVFTFGRESSTNLPGLPTSQSNLGSLNNNSSGNNASTTVNFTSKTDPAPIDAATTNVNELLQQVRSQACGDVAQMMKALEQRRKHDQEVLNAFYALAKKELIANSR